MSTDPNLNNPDEYTLEQRKLLAKAYRLILNWKREEPEPQSSAFDAARNKSKKHPAASSSAPPYLGPGEKKHV